MPPHTVYRAYNGATADRSLFLRLTESTMVEVPYKRRSARGSQSFRKDSKARPSRAKKSKPAPLPKVNVTPIAEEPPVADGSSGTDLDSDMFSSDTESEPVSEDDAPEAAPNEDADASDVEKEDEAEDTGYNSGDSSDASDEEPASDDDVGGPKKKKKRAREVSSKSLRASLKNAYRILEPKKRRGEPTAKPKALAVSRPHHAVRPVARPSSKATKPAPSVRVPATPRPAARPVPLPPAQMPIGVPTPPVVARLPLMALPTIRPVTHGNLLALFAPQLQTRPIVRPVAVPLACKQ